MKKVLCAVLLMLCLFTGCSNDGKVKNIEPLPQNFSAEVAITNEYSQYIAVLTKENEKITLSYSSPDALSGLKISNSPEGFQLDFLGMTASSYNLSLPQKAPLSILYGVFEKINIADNNGYTLRKVGEKYYYSIIINEKEYQLVRDVKTLDILSVSSPSESVNIEFTSFEKAE